MGRVSGPFRIDDVSTAGRQVFIRAKVGLGKYGGYVTLRSDAAGAGIYCDETGEHLLSVEQFLAGESESIPEIAARFSRAMLAAGLGPMYDMNNDVCARVPEEVDTLKFYPRGHVGPFR